MRVSLRSVPRAAVAGTLALLVAVAPAGASQLVAPSTTAQSTTAQRAPSTAAAIPDPDEYFGFPIGSDGRLATFDKMNTYYKLVAGKSDRVTYEKIGDTTLGNPYAMLTISSPKNLKNLDHLMDINARLADPRGLSDAEAKALARQGQAVLLRAGRHPLHRGGQRAGDAGDRAPDGNGALDLHGRPAGQRRRADGAVAEPRRDASSSTTTSPRPRAPTTPACIPTCTRSTPVTTTTATGSCSPRSSPR